jgi:hypothetical protein
MYKSRPAEVMSAARESFCNTFNFFPHQNEEPLLVMWWTLHAQLNIVNNI